MKELRLLKRITIRSVNEEVSQDWLVSYSVHQNLLYYSISILSPLDIPNKMSIHKYDYISSLLLL